MNNLPSSFLKAEINAQWALLHFNEVVQHLPEMLKQLGKDPAETTQIQQRLLEMQTALTKLQLFIDSQIEEYLQTP